MTKTKEFLLSIVYDNLKENNFSYNSCYNFHNYNINLKCYIKIYSDFIFIFIEDIQWKIKFVELEYKHKHILELIYDLFKNNEEKIIKNNLKIIKKNLTTTQHRRLKLNQIL